MLDLHAGLSSIHAMTSDPVLSVTDLKTWFDTRAGILKAVDGIDLEVSEGEILGLVGESGSGKSITGFSLLGLVDQPGYIAGGSIKYLGEELTIASDNRLRQLRGTGIAMIFQDPMMTLNPVLRIDTQMIEALRAHKDISHRAARERCLEVLAQVGIAAPEERLTIYPHQLSGGMRQRIAIAIALLHKPKLIIADEPTTALDVTIQAQILFEVQKLCAETGTALIWITHDLAIVSGLADRIAVMYAGRIVEQGPASAIIERPTHPYTRGLLESVPSRNARGQKLRQIPGMAPSLLTKPQGCAFGPRCQFVRDQCRLEEPGITQIDGRSRRCHVQAEEVVAA